MFDTKPYQEKVDQAIAHYEDELKKVRTGRAHPSQLDGIRVEVYGTLMPLNHVANITAPEAQLLQISPFDPSNLNMISAAIRNAQNLDMNPSDDGHVIRISVPSLTEERRKLLVKQASEKVEEAKIVIRNIRQDALKEAKRKKEAKDMSDDDEKRVEKAIDEIVASSNLKVDELFRDKEKDILTI